MKHLFFIMLILCYTPSSKAQSDIYSSKLQSLDDKSISFSDFRGKNLLLVCIDSADQPAIQLVEYKQLGKQFGDSGFAIIVCLIDSRLSDSSFSKSGSLMTSKTSFKDAFTSDWVTIIRPPTKEENTGSLYEWLSTSRKNGITDEPIVHNGFKYLINRNGQITGIFSRHIRPMDPEIITAIENSK